MNDSIPFEDILGRRITNIYCKYGKEQGWLDTAECFIELDKQLVTYIPWTLSESRKLELLEVAQGAKSLFSDLSDIPVYYVNKEEKSIGEVRENHEKRKNQFFHKLLNKLLGFEPLIREYRPYKTTYLENKLKYIKDKKIVDFIWFEEEDFKGFFLLENGYLITDTTMAPHGTGMAGLNCFENIEKLMERRGTNYEKLTDHLKSANAETGKV